MRLRNYRNGGATIRAFALWVTPHARLTAHARGRRSFFYSVTNWSAIESAQIETRKTQTTTATTIHIKCPAADQPNDGRTCNTQEKWWLDGHGQAATTAMDMHSSPRCVNGQAKRHDSILATPTATTRVRIKANTRRGTGKCSVTIGNSTLQICSNGRSQRLPIPGGSNNNNNDCFLTMLVVAAVVATSAFVAWQLTWFFAWNFSRIRGGNCGAGGGAIYSSQVLLFLLLCVYSRFCRLQLGGIRLSHWIVCLIYFAALLWSGAWCFFFLVLYISFHCSVVVKYRY